MSNHARPPSRPHMSTRSSTLGSPEEMGRAHSKADYDPPQHARSEDLNHTYHSATLQPRRQPHACISIPQPTVNTNDSQTATSSSNHSDHGSSTPSESSPTMKRTSTASLSTTPSATSKLPGAPTTVCAACSLVLEGAFVRALGNVWHLQCFKCKV